MHPSMDSMINPPKHSTMLKTRGSLMLCLNYSITIKKKMRLFRLNQLSKMRNLMIFLTYMSSLPSAKISAKKSIFKNMISD
jgi:hypothetical protein